MRFLHTSDWHLGRRLHGVDLTADADAFLQWLHATAVTERVSAVVVAGDIYDRALPPVEAVDLLDRTVAAFAASGIPLLLTSGNHDSAVRLRFGQRLFTQSGIHLRTSLETVAEPLILSDESGPVGFYGIPYLIPDQVMDQLGAANSHESVLSAVVKRITDDAAERGLRRTVVAAHAFVRGGSGSDSEREISVGGVGDLPAAVFDGCSYVALGHLHGPQQVRLDDSATVLGYSGSPLAFSFSERDHVKSVALVDLDATGRARVERLPVPVGRPMRQVRGEIADLIARADTDLAELRDCFVKVVLTDARCETPMARLQAVWPHTLCLEFEPAEHLVDPEVDLRRLSATASDLEITQLFVEYVSGVAADEAQQRFLAEAVSSAQPGEPTEIRRGA